HPHRDVLTAASDGATRTRGPYRGDQAVHPLGPVEGRARADPPPQKPRTDEDFGEIPRLLADEASQRQGVKELTIDDELGDEDAGPQAQSPEIESGNPYAGRRPDRGNRRRVAERLAKLCPGVVRGGH